MGCLTYQVMVLIIGTLLNKIIMMQKLELLTHVANFIRINGMGMYTGLRGWVMFTQEITEKVKPFFEDINKEWNELGITETKEFIIFSSDSRSSFIPYGAICYMPDDWVKSNTYDEENFIFHFSCSLKNYDDTIEKFIDWLNLQGVAMDFCLEERYEENDSSTFHTPHSISNKQLATSFEIVAECDSFQFFKDRIETSLKDEPIKLPSGLTKEEKRKHIKKTAKKYKIKKMSIVKWIGSCNYTDYPFNDTQRYIYHGEIPNMGGHCVVSDMKTGQLYSGYHISDFRAVIDD